MRFSRIANIMIGRYSIISSVNLNVNNRSHSDLGNNFCHKMNDFSMIQFIVLYKHFEILIHLNTYIKTNLQYLPKFTFQIKLFNLTISDQNPKSFHIGRC